MQFVEEDKNRYNFFIYSLISNISHFFNWCANIKRKKTNKHISNATNITTHHKRNELEVEEKKKETTIVIHFFFFLVLRPKMGGIVSSRISGGHRFIDNIILTDEQINQLNASWIIIEESGTTEIGEIAFKGLFRQAPETFTLFTSFSMLDDWENSKAYKHHCNVVLKILGSVIKVILDPQLLNRNMDYMGMRHSLMPVKPEHFDILGREFIVAFQTVCGDRFTTEMRDAWIIVYDILSRMLQKHIASYNKEFEHLQSKFN